MKRGMLLSITMLIVYAGQAQTSDSTKALTVTVGAMYNSSLNYYGRTDSIKSQGYIGFAGLTHKSGLYVFSNVIFINSGLAATTVEAGYQFKNQKGNFKGNIFGTAFFYQEDITLVQSVVKQQTGINLSQLNNILNIHAGADAKFSNQTDLGAYAGLDHHFRFENVGKGVIVIAPAAYSYFGTQRFSKTYLQQKRFLLFPVGEEEITQNSSAFNALSYEFSCPIIYGIGKMNVIINPAYVLPQHVIATDGTPMKADALFYTTATIRFDF